MGAKPIGMDGWSSVDFAFDNRIKRVTRAVRNDLGINAAVAFIDAEDDPFYQRLRGHACREFAWHQSTISIARLLPKKEIRFRNMKRSADGSMSNIGSPYSGLDGQVRLSEPPSDQRQMTAISDEILPSKFECVSEPCNLLSWLHLSIIEYLSASHDPYIICIWVPIKCLNSCKLNTVKGYLNKFSYLWNQWVPGQKQKVRQLLRLIISYLFKQ